VADRVDPAGGAVAFEARDEAGDDTGHHDCLQAEGADGVVELGNGLVRSERRYGRDGLESIAEVAVRLGVVDVERAGHRLSQFVVGHAGDREAVCGIEQRVVDSDLVEALIHQRRQHRSRAIDGVLRGQSPERHARGVGLPSLVGRHHARVLAAVDHALEAFGDRRVGDIADDVFDDGEVFDEMAVAVDDRVVDAVAYRGHFVGGGEGDVHC
jgi:hypothetical protein